MEKMKKNIGFKIIAYVFVFIILIVYLFPIFYAINTSLKIKLEYT